MTEAVPLLTVSLSVPLLNAAVELPETKWSVVRSMVSCAPAKLVMVPGSAVVLVIFKVA